MKKNKQPKPKNIGSRAEKEQRGKTAMPSEKPADDGWERLLKIKEKLRKQGKATASSEKSDDEGIERLTKIGEEISKNWQGEKSAVEILSEMRR